MGTNLVLPAPSARGLVLNSDRDLAARLRSSLSLQISTSWKTSESGRDALESVDCTRLAPSEAKQALAILDEESKPAEAAHISKALGIVVAVCVRPADMDDPKVFVWGERMRRVLSEYPAAVALAALNEWPQSDSGKFWPTEHEIRNECYERMSLRERLRHRFTVEAERVEEPPKPKPSDGMFDDPVGNTAELVARFKAKDEVRANMYLNGARYTAGSIGVHSMLAQAQVQKFARENGFDDVLVKVPYVMRDDNTVAEWGL